jgi:type IV pilus assembly protein PilE
MKHASKARSRATSARSRGFTLIELMITLAIVAILAALAYPSYSAYVVRSNRAAAEGYLLELSNLQQRYLLDKRGYAASMTDLLGAAWAAPSNVASYYTIDTTAPPAGAPTPGFRVVATPLGNQSVRDTACGTVQIDETGQKYASGTQGASACW